MRNAMLVVLLALPVGWFVFGQQPAPAPAPARESLTSAELGKLLKDMGYEPEALTPEVWQVAITRDGWKVHVMLSLDGNGDRLWFESKFAVIAVPDLVPASAWFRLLGANERIGPAYFAFDRNDNRIHLYKTCDNVGIAPIRLKKELETFDGIVRKTQNLWRAENFMPAETLPVVPRPVEIRKLSPVEGNWRITRIETRGESVPEDKLTATKPTVTIRDDKGVIKTGLEPDKNVTVKVDPMAKPASIDFTDENGKTEQGIYIFEAGLLIICVAGPGEDRPRQFITDPNNKFWLLVLKKDER